MFLPKRSSGSGNAQKKKTRGAINYNCTLHSSYSPFVVAEGCYSTDMLYKYR